MEADLGSTVTLSCNVDGNPAPEIVWFHEPTRNVSFFIELHFLNTSEFKRYDLFHCCFLPLSKKLWFCQTCGMHHVNMYCI